MEDSGRFQMNYDNKADKFVFGASISGQIQLKDGAILENSLIYSNTNNIAEGWGESTITNRKMDAVVSVTGNVSVVGKVFIKGDEAPVLDDDTVERGQAGLSIKDGKLHIKENSTLGVYGGGIYALTSNGGTAIELDNGEIVGQGELIAVGGNGFGGFGVTAIDGSGNVLVEKAFIQGGDTRWQNGEVGKPFGEDILVSKNTVGVAEKGSALTGHNDNDHPYYWKSSSTQLPNTDLPFGEEKIVKQLRTIEDNGIKVKGNINSKGRLVVTRINELPQQIIDKINTMPGKVAVEKYDIRIVGGRFIEGLSVEIPVYSNKAKVDLLHLKKNGQIEVFEAEVVDGKISVDVTDLSPFVVVDDKEEADDKADNGENANDNANNQNGGDSSSAVDKGEDPSNKPNGSDEAASKVEDNKDIKGTDEKASSEKNNKLDRDKASMKKESRGVDTSDASRLEEIFVALVISLGGLGFLGRRKKEK